MRIMKKCIWFALVILMSWVLILEGKAIVDMILDYPDLTVGDYDLLDWTLQKLIVFHLPIWFLVLLGLIRSFLGGNWFPFAERIPVSVTKTVMAAAAILWVGLAVFSAVYLRQIQKSYDLYFRMESVFSRWRTVFPVILYYSVLLYIEQWSIQRNCSRQDTRKIQVWITVTLFLTCLIAVFVGGVGLGYIPLGYVDSLNRLEDYYLWWFYLYLAVFLLPLWFFSARKTVRLLRGDAQWLTLSTILPKKMTAWIALILTGLMVWQIQEGRYYGALTMDVPEYAEAAAMGHMYQAMLWGLALFYMLCLLVRQIRSAHKVKRTP